jgi:hypothetical protein
MQRIRELVAENLMPCSWHRRSSDVIIVSLFFALSMMIVINCDITMKHHSNKTEEHMMPYPSSKAVEFHCHPNCFGHILTGVFPYKFLKINEKFF